jgi:hypothetical protein
VREWAPRLLAAGVRRRDVTQLHAALDLLVPPQSVLLAAGVTGALAPATRRTALAALAGQAAFVLGGLALVRAPTAVWRALAFAPVLAADKLILLTRLSSGRGPRGWADQPRSRAAMRRSWSRRA